MSVVDANVLVLNLDYQPLNVCNVKRAVVLLSKQKAVVIEQDGHIVHSERLALTSPSVIRLAYHIQRPRPVVKMTRKELLQRDEHMCQYCGKRSHELTLDHVHDTAVARAYDRGERLEERKRLMTWWDGQLTGTEAT